jgi:uncharacterized protein with PIN domain
MTPEQQPSPVDDAMESCAACGGRLLPLTYTLAIAGEPDGLEDRPFLKCAGCGQRYRWHGSGWHATV